MLFTESAPRPIKSTIRNVCVYKNVALINDRNCESLTLLVKECINNIGKPKTPFYFVFLCIFNRPGVAGDVLQTASSLFNLVILFLQTFKTSLHKDRKSLGADIWRERWGSVAVGTSFKWQVTGDMRHLACEIWHKTYEKWNMSLNFYADPRQARVYSTNTFVLLHCVHWEIQFLPYAY